MKPTRTSSRSKKTTGSVLTAGEAGELEVSTNWHLPSGKRLEEFALEGGYLAPLLLRTANFADWQPVSREKKRS